MMSQRSILALSTLIALFFTIPTLLSAFAPQQSDLPVTSVPLAPHKAIGPEESQLSRLEELLAQQPLTVRWAKETGAPRLMEGRLFTIEEKDGARLPEMLIERFSALFGVRDGVDALALVKEARSYSYTHRTLEQSYMGIPVWRTKLLVHSDGAGMVRTINGEFYRDIECSIEPELSAEAARDISLGMLGIRADAEYSWKQRMVIAPTTTFRLSFEIKIQCDEPLGEWVFLIDAQNGELLYMDNQLCFGRVQGDLYEVNPEKTPAATLPLRDLEVKKLGDSYFTDADGYFDATDATVTAFLEGPYCKALNADSSRARYSGEPNEILFSYETHDTHFDEVCSFYHVNQIHAWLKECLEFDGMDFQVAVTVQYGDNLNNAFYSPSNNGIYLGGGSSRDPAHEADIVMHEYGHAVVHNTVALDFSTSMLDEGYADYFTCSLHDDPLLGEWWRPPYLRNLDNDLVYPFDMVDEGHHDGQIWSGALWDIREIYGAEVSDRLALGALFYLSSAPDFMEARNAVISADEEYFGSEHLASIVEIFCKRGISEIRTSSWSITETEGNGDGLVDPGETLELEIQVRNVVDDPIPASYLALTSMSEYAEVISGLSPVPAIDAKKKAQTSQTLSFVVSPDCPPDGTLEFNVKMGYDVDAIIYAGSLEIALGSAPQIVVSDYKIVDFTGNRDMEANAGEMIVPLISLINEGGATAGSVRLMAYTDSPYVNSHEAYSSMYSNSVGYGDIGPGQDVSDPGSDDSVILLLDSDTPDGHQFQLDYDITEDNGRMWTGSIDITVTGEDETAPWVAMSQANPRLVNRGDFFYCYVFVVEPGDIQSVSGKLHNREGEDFGSVYFIEYYSGLYMGYGLMPANEDLFLDVTTRDAKGNSGVKKNTCALGPTKFETECKVLYVADDFADISQTRQPTMDALAAIGLDVDVWETEIRSVPGNATLSKYLDGLVIFETKYNPINMSHTAYLAYLPSAISDYLDKGGKALLMGQRFGSFYSAYYEQGTFLEDYFGVELVGSKSADEQIVLVGTEGDPITDGLTLNLVQGDIEYQTTPDILNPIGNCQPILRFADNLSQKAGVSVEADGYRAAYMTVNLCDIESEQDRNLLLSRIIEWLNSTVHRPSGLPIYAGGFGGTTLTSEGGLLKVQAFANPLYGIDSIELYYDNIPLGIPLFETDDNYYSAEVEIGPVAPGSYALSLVALLDSGEQIVVWPYLPVGAYEDWTLASAPPIAETPAPMSADAPKILAAGFCATDISYDLGGTLHVVAQVSDPDGLDDIESVSMALDLPGGLLLLDLFDDGLNGDFASNDGIFGTILQVQGLSTGLHPATIVAKDTSGGEGHWPQITIGE